MIGSAPAALAVEVAAQGAAGAAGVGGSVFGIAAGQTFLGMSTAAGSGLLGFSMATTVLTGGIAVLAFAGIGVYFYLRRRGRQVEQARSQILLQEPELVATNSAIWSPFSMTVEQFISVCSFADEGQFRDMVRQLICPITRQVMKVPCQMNCCRELVNKEDRWADKWILELQITKHDRCVLCQQPATLSSIKVDKLKSATLFGIRAMVLKTYLTLPNQVRPAWKQLIREHFGNDYVEKHLGSVIG